MPLATAPANPPIISVDLPDVAPDVKAVISQLWIHPIKSCAGISVQEAWLQETGLEFDRAWMVVDREGQAVTQRELPRMALIAPQLRTFDMVLRAPGMLALHIALDRAETPVQVNLWGEKLAAFDMGSLAAQWFSDFLGQALRLVRFDPDSQRLCDPAWTGGAQALNQFSDGFSLLIVSQPSLDGLNQRLETKAMAAVGMNRFRPNIVIAQAPPLPGEIVDNTLLAHDEDRLERLQIQTQEGIADIRPVKPCSRCPIPNIDPLTTQSSPEVGDTLQGYRQDARLDGAVTFGMNAVLHGKGEANFRLHVGQQVAGFYGFGD